MFRKALVIAAALSLGSGCAKESAGPYDAPAPVIDSPSWYKEVVFYQIYPRSFKDSDGDGIGDLEGITEKLGYLQDLGVGGVWLNPVYPTKNVDLGYDITDYRAINPEFGTMDDFARLLAEAHARNLRIFMDLVFNHTSDGHSWFQESRSSKSNPMREWYIWALEPYFQCDDLPESIGTFGSSRWAYDPLTGEYYFHQFYEGMPDLNFHHPAVREELLDTVSYWLDKGVDGFRLDVAHSYYENPEENSCRHQPETHRFLKDMRGVLDRYENRALVGEVSLLAEDVIPYLGDGTDELHMYFNFILTPAMLSAALGGGAPPVVDTMERTYRQFPPGGWHAIIIGNHDLPRPFALVSESVEKAKTLAALQLTLPGTPFIYYGEEIGIANGKHIVVDGRDAARTPMQWNGTENTGFSAGETWIPPSPNYLEHNVAAEREDPDSLFHHYRKLIRLRNAVPALRSGSYQPVDTGDSAIVAFFRTSDKGESLLAILNTTGRERRLHVDLSLTPFAGAHGGVMDIWNDRRTSEISADNVGSYPIVLEPYSLNILRPE